MKIEILKGVLTIDTPEQMVPKKNMTSNPNSSFSFDFFDNGPAGNEGFTENIRPLVLGNAF